MDDDSGSEETGSELRDDQTDTSSAEVPSVRPWRAVTLRSSLELERQAPVERVRRGRRAQAAPGAEAGDRGPAASRDTAEVTPMAWSWLAAVANRQAVHRENTLLPTKKGLQCRTPV